MLIILQGQFRGFEKPDLPLEQTNKEVEIAASRARQQLTFIDTSNVKIQKEHTDLITFMLRPLMCPSLMPNQTTSK